VQPFVWDDFSKTPQMVAAGEVATLAAIPQIRAAIARHPEQTHPNTHAAALRAQFEAKHSPEKK